MILDASDRFFSMSLYLYMYAFGFCLVMALPLCLPDSFISIVLSCPMCGVFGCSLVYILYESVVGSQTWLPLQSSNPSLCPPPGVNPLYSSCEPSPSDSYQSRTFPSKPLQLSYINATPAEDSERLIKIRRRVALVQRARSPSESHYLE
jgi:hypothetical protein